MRQAAIVGLFCAFVGMISVASGQNGSLLCSILTDEGWQIARYDLKGAEISIVTSGVGDKRNAQQLPEGGGIVYRNANGELCTIGENSFWDAPGGVSSFCFSLLPEMSVYFTRLATGNPQRQFLWERPPARAAETALVYRPPTGSVRQVSLAPDGQSAILTWIRKKGEESLIRVWLTGKRRGETDVISEEMTINAYPSWSPDGLKLYFSRFVERGDFDLWVHDFATGATKSLLERPDSSELSPTISGDGNHLYFEQRDGEGSALWSLDIANGKTSRLPISQSTREPLWINDTK